MAVCLSVTFACACWVTAGSAPVVLRVRGRDKSPITLASCRICHLGVPALRSSGPVVSRDSALDLQGRFCGTLYSPLVDSIESHVRLFSFLGTRWVALRTHHEYINLLQYVITSISGLIFGYLWQFIQPTPKTHNSYN